MIRSRPLPRSPFLSAGALMATGIVAVVMSLLTGSGSAYAYPPTPPSAEEARGLLAELTVSPESSESDYDRDLFPHWRSQYDNCNTREVVLQRDGQDVYVDDSCQPTSGSWYSVYDSVWVADSSDVQIDHIVALSEAWVSGADTWSQTVREEFANDLAHAQLIAVSGSSNQEKSNLDPAEWMPENESVHCIYVREWIWVKSVYDLSIDEAEHAALEAILSGC